MARNREKNLTELNRLFLAKQERKLHRKREYKPSLVSTLVVQLILLLGKSFSN